MTYYLGIDLAWGDRNGDGLCLILASEKAAQVVAVDYTIGDTALLSWMRHYIPQGAPAFVTVDAPIVIKNHTGSRPVDRLTHVLFHKQHAACHPANLKLCPRPARIARLLEENGFAIGWDRTQAARQVAEVFPHPAIVRLFKLDRIIKYKRGPMAKRRTEFARLQSLTQELLEKRFPELALDEQMEALLSAPWTKPVEDRLDAFFCVLIGWLHGEFDGKRTEVIGDLEAGFILLPIEEK